MISVSDLLAQGKPIDEENDYNNENDNSRSSSDVVDYTVAIIGCGPAGLSCWMSLTQNRSDQNNKNKNKMKVLLVDSGKGFEQRDRESAYELTTGN